MKKENGITLIALVITVIILLILAGISVAVMTGENGIINKANIAKEITKIEEYREDLQLIGEGLKPDKVIEQLTSKEYMDRYEEEIKKDERYEKVKRKDDETIRVTTKEGYVYIITTEKVEYIGKEGEITPPDLQESDIEFKNTPTKWTNKEVTVEIEKKNEEIGDYILQYSIDGVTWKNYTEPIIVKDNGAVYARLVNNIGDTGGYATGNVTNIDKTAPTVSAQTSDITYNSAKLTVTANDEQSGLAASETYKYYLGDTLKSTSTTNSYTFTELTTATNNTLKVIVTDQVGNTTEKSIEVAIAGLPSTSNTKPFLPTGATGVEGDIDSGLVIRDANNNEWVWVEVPKSIYKTAKSSTDYTNIEKDMQTYAAAYESSASGVDTFASTAQAGFSNSTEYNNWKNSMLKSVYENGGFYIGRYETGTDIARSPDATLTTPVIKRDMYPYTCITGTQAQNLSKQLATGGRVGSKMFGIQWNLTMKFIEVKGAKTQSELKVNSNSWGNYYEATFEVTRGKATSTPHTSTSWNSITKYTKPNTGACVFTTGVTDRNKALNIYDLAGNVCEATLSSVGNIEVYGVESVVNRGGLWSGKASGTGAYANQYGCYTGSLSGNAEVGFRTVMW